MTDGFESMRSTLRTDRPTPARMYDYYLGGKDNFEVDRAAVDAMGPQINALLAGAAWENRRFLWRAVEHLARECGITQFIDVGSGLPTVRSTHEIVQEVNPDARVVYVDNDPIVLSHGQALLAKNGNTRIVSADVRDPESVLDADGTRELIDFSQPVAVLIVSLFHFITAPGHPRHEPGDPSPAEILAVFAKRVAPRSYLALSHATFEETPPDEIAIIEEAYKGATSPVIFRSRAEIEELFAGWRVLPPGIVRPWAWPAEDLESSRSGLFYAGVGVK